MQRYSTQEDLGARRSSGADDPLVVSSNLVETLCGATADCYSWQAVLDALRDDLSAAWVGCAIVEWGTGQIIHAWNATDKLDWTARLDGDGPWPRLLTTLRDPSDANIFTFRSRASDSGWTFSLERDAECRVAVLECSVGRYVLIAAIFRKTLALSRQQWELSSALARLAWRTRVADELHLELSAWWRLLAERTATACVKINAGHVVLDSYSPPTCEPPLAHYLVAETGHRVRAIYVLENVRLEMTIKQALAGDTAQGLAIVLRGRSADCPHAVANIHVLPEQLSGIASSRTVLLCVRVARPTPMTETSRALLCEAFELTDAEATLAGALLAGQSMNTIAATQGRALTTVRTHLRALFRKSGTHRQADLLAVLRAAL